LEVKVSPKQNRPPAATMCCPSMLDIENNNGQQVSWPDVLVALHPMQRVFARGRGAIRGPDRHVFL
jgi:hypothetical protein